MSAYKIIKSPPRYAPYFAFVGIGASMAITFASWRLTSGPDVIINKLRADPWNDVEQGTNTKLYTRRPDWWAARAAADMPHPQAAFREEKESSITRALAAKRKLRKMDEAAKAKAATDSVM